MRKTLILLIVLVFWINIANCVVLKVATNPDSCNGGSACSVQPIIHALDADGNIDVSIGGADSVYALLQYDPNNRASVLTNSAVNFVAGIATFTDFQIDLEGTGFVVRFESSTLLAMVDSSEFAVVPGPATQLKIKIIPDAAYGGEYFKVQPSVVIADAGGNTVPTASDIPITVSLNRNDPGGVLECILGTLETSTVNGVADFYGLYIKLAGGLYQLRFTTTMALASPTVDSHLFEVGIGDPAKAIISTPIAGITGGSPFTQQPGITLQDKGGNTCTNLDHDIIVAEIVHKPADGGSLFPEWHEEDLGDTLTFTAGSRVVSCSTATRDKLFQTDIIRCGPIGNKHHIVYAKSYLLDPTDHFYIQEAATATASYSSCYLLTPGNQATVTAGVATFEDLYIDKIGIEYVMRFSLMKDDDTLSSTIYVETDRFSVDFSGSNKLVLHKVPDAPYAGRQAFWPQPQIAVTDSGGNIITTDDSSRIYVDFASNPTGTELLGDRVVIAERGIAYYKNLQIKDAGTYQLRFWDVLNPTVEVFWDVTVQYSFSNELIPDDGQIGDGFGSAVDIDGDYAVVGSPFASVPLEEIQIIEIAASTAEFVNEVQSITQVIGDQSKIQTITTSTTANNVLDGGTYTLEWNGDESRELPWDLDPISLQTLLEQDFEDVGRLSVTYATNDVCDCNGRVYTVTFIDQQGDFPDITLASNSLTGTGTPSVIVAPIQDSSYLEGTFTITHPLVSPTFITVDHDVGVEELKRALNQDLGLDIRGVAKFPLNTDRQTYQYILTLSPSLAVYDIDAFEVNYSGLSGGPDINMVVQTIVEGKAPVAGSFKVSYDKAGPTIDIDYNASVEEVKAIVETLPTLDSVSVSKNILASNLGHQYVVTFHAASSVDIYGTQSVDMDNMPMLVVDSTGLTGSDASAKVWASVYHPINPSWLTYRMGQIGKLAGKAYLYERESGTENNWNQIYDLEAEDTDQFDRFGESVAVEGDFVAVGAPGAAFIGIREVQRFTCEATMGTFTVAFEGQTITVDATRTIEEFQQDLSTFLHIQGVHLETSATNVCESPATQIDIHFEYPRLGDFDEFVVTATASLEISSGVGGSVTNVELEKGTSDQLDSQYYAQAGAVYIFQKTLGNWNFLTKLLSTNRQVGDEFGSSISMDGDFLVIGAPGYEVNGFSDCGAVFVFEKSGSVWSLRDTLYPLEPSENSHFGSSVVFDDLTLLVGNPGYNSKQGRVEIFYRSVSTGPFLFFEYFTNPTPLSSNEEFGHSLSLSGDRLSVGIPNHGTDSSGIVQVWKRPAFGLTFHLTQELETKIEHTRRRFGHAVAIGDSVLVAGGLVDNDEPLKSHAPVQRIVVSTSSTTASASITGSFKVGWYKDGPVTDDIPIDASPTYMKNVLESSLETGLLRVSRRGPDVNNGYEWTIVFVDKFSAIPLMFIENSALRLVGDEITGAQVTINSLLVPNNAIKSVVSVFERVDETWTEQALLEPQPFEQADLFGSTIAMDGDFVIIGAPNRDSANPGVNHGAAYVYDTRFLEYSFSESQYECDEFDGDTPITINRSSALVDSYMWFSTHDGDAWYPLSSKPDSELFSNPAKSHASCLQSSKSTDECFWISVADGVNPSIYDFHGISDYAPWTELLSFPTATTSKSVSITITDDERVEVPDEVFLVKLSSPGIIPMFGGKMWSSVLIHDDGDGGVGSQTTMAKLLPWQNDRTYNPWGVINDSDNHYHAGFGESTDMKGDIAVFGAPFETVDGVTSAGKVYIFEKSLGFWEELQILTIPVVASTNDQFGASVATDGSRVIIGSPGKVSVYVYTRSGSGEEFTLEDTLIPSVSTNTNSQFGAHGSIDIDDNVIVVGAAGLESVFVYEYHLGSWSMVQSLRSSDWMEVNVNGFTETKVSLFGHAVSLQDRTIVVGAPRSNDHDKVNINRTQSSDERFWGEGRVYVFIRDLDTSDSNGVWSEDETLEPDTSFHAGQFGHSVDVDGNAVIVGGVAFPTASTTTWSFETGDLTGWQTTGTAFNNQPTFGDNAYHRPEYENWLKDNKPERSMHAGRYWIGTYENRMGDLTNEDNANYNVPSDTFAGQSQGDKPIGTLISSPFKIMGKSISFMIGGGCDVSREYVELLIGNKSVFQKTGQCTEHMERRYWNVEPYIGQMARIRVVDAYDGEWGHINFDDVRFDWDLLDEPKMESGSAFVFHRRNPTTNDPCGVSCTHAGGCVTDADKSNCEWTLEAKLQPSDVNGFRFGEEVIISESEEIAIVSAPNAQFSDQFRNIVEGTDEAGAVYLFKRTPEKRDAMHQLVSASIWETPTESFRLQAINGKTLDHFHSIALDGQTLVVAAPGDDTRNIDCGAAYIYDISLHKISFKVEDIKITESHETTYFAVELIREEPHTTTQIISLSTSDITGRSITKVNSDLCDALPLSERKASSYCGDLLQSTQTVEFKAGYPNTHVFLHVINDRSEGDATRTIQLQLFMPGQPPLLGNNHQATLIIDDDDYGKA